MYVRKTIYGYSKNIVELYYAVVEILTTNVGKCVNGNRGRK